MQNNVMLFWNGIWVNVTKSSSHRKNTVSFRIREGKLHVSTALRYPNDEIIAALEKKRSWIMKHLNNPLKKASVEWRNGAEIYILGQKYLLNLAYAPKGRLELSGDRCIVYGPSEKSWLNAYRKYAENILDDLLDQFRRELKYEVGDYTLRYRFYTSRWGCCFWKKREVILNYYCLALPEEAIRYIFYHELAHLEVNNHQKAFYDHLSLLDPNYKVGLKMSKSFTIT